MSILMPSLCFSGLLWRRWVNSAIETDKDKWLGFILHLFLLWYFIWNSAVHLFSYSVTLVKNGNFSWIYIHLRLASFYIIVFFINSGNPSCWNVRAISRTLTSPQMFSPKRPFRLLHDINILQCSLTSEKSCTILWPQQERYKILQILWARERK